MLRKGLAGGAESGEFYAMEFVEGKRSKISSNAQGGWK
jgi:hypothetical protein